MKNQAQGGRDARGRNRFSIGVTCRRRLQRVVLSLIVCFAPALHAQSQENPDADKDAPPRSSSAIQLSAETTVISEPLDDEGYPDYIEALNAAFGEGVTAENNAAAVLAQAVALGDFTPEQRAEYYRRLGIAPVAEETPRLVDVFDYYQLPPYGAEKDELGDALDQAMRSPWNADDYPKIAKWLEASRPSLELVEQAADRPRFFMPLIKSGQRPETVSVSLDPLMQLRAAARALAARAMLHAGAQQFEAAWKDLRTLQKLAAHTAGTPTLIGGLISISFEGLAVAATQGLITSADIPATLLTQIQQDLARLGPLPDMAKSLDEAERFMYLDAVLAIQRDGVEGLQGLVGDGGEGRTAMQMVRNAIFTSSIDWNQMLRDGNDAYDRILRAVRKPTHAERQAAYEVLDEWLKQQTQSARGLGGLSRALLSGKTPRQVLTDQMSAIMVGLFLPASQTVTIAADRAEVHRALSRIAVALQRYKREHETYPESLAQLKPKYLAEIPHDLFTGESFFYVREADGYRLYSAGPDGKDDEGRQYGDEPYADDIALASPPQ